MKTCSARKTQPSCLSPEIKLRLIRRPSDKSRGVDGRFKFSGLIQASPGTNPTVFTTHVSINLEIKLMIGTILLLRKQIVTSLKFP